MPTILPAAVLTWVGTAGDENWFNPNNWNPIGLPTSSDTVEFNAGSCIVPASATFAVLNLNGGALYGVFSLTKTLNWTGGSLAARLTVTSTGVLNITGDSNRFLLSTITNRGTVVWSQAGRIYATETSIFYNAPTGVWNIQGDPSYIWDSLTVTNARVVNAGLLRRTSGSGTNLFTQGISFTNIGTMEVQTGTIRFDDIFYNQGTNQIWSGGVMRLRGGGGGAGHYNIAPGGTVYLGHGAFNFLPGLTVAGGGFFGVIGIVEFHGVLTVTNLTLTTGGDLSGSFTNAGVMNWHDGTLSGQLTIAPGGVLNMTSNTFLNGTLTNYGTVVWSASAVIFAGETSLFCNARGGLCDVQGDASYVWNSLTLTNARVVNQGVLRKSAGAGTNLFSQGIIFFNTGTIEVQSGTLRFDDLFYNQGTNRVWSGAVIRLRGGGGGAGFYDIAPGGTVYLGDGIFNFLPGLAVAGGGLFEMIGDIEVRGILSLTNLVLSADSNIRGVFTNAGTMTWSAGTLAGHLTVAPGGVLHISGDTYLIGTITNRGTVLWNSPGTIHASETSVFCNTAAGVWDIQGDLSYSWNTLTLTNARVYNAGLLRKNAGSGTNLFSQGITFSNTGTIEVQSGTLRLDDVFYNEGTNHIWSSAVLRLRGGGGGAGHYEVAPGGAFYLGRGVFHFLPELTVSGGGVFEVVGIVELHGVLSVTNLTLTTDANLSGNFTNAGVMNWTDGTLSGHMTVTPAGFLSIISNAYLIGTITNRGTIVQAGNIYAADSAIFCNEPGGVWEIQGNASYIWNSTNLINTQVVNAGLLRKGGPGTNIFTAGVPFQNSGIVEVQSGTLRFNDVFYNQGTNQISSGATLTLTMGGSEGGLFDIAPGAAVNLGGGSYTFLPDFTVTGGGFFNVVGGIELYGALAGNLVLTSGGNIGGAFTNFGTLTWTGGDLSGRVTVAPGGTLHITSNAFLSGTITNHGTVVWSQSANIYATETSIFCNAPGGVWEIEGDLSYSWNSLTLSNALVVNEGLLRRTAGTGTNLFTQGVSFYNTGTLEVQTGTMRFDDVFFNQGTNQVWSNAVMRLRGGGGGAGVYDIAPGGTVYLGRGSFTFAPGLTVSGGGLFQVIGEVHLYGTLTITNLGLGIGGNIQGAFTNAGIMNWTGGDLSGQLTIAPGGVLNISGETYLIGTITNRGTVVWSPPGAIHASETSVLCNARGGVWEVQGDVAYVWNTPSLTNAWVINAGSLRKTSGTGTNLFTAGVLVINTGTIEVQSGTMRFDDLFYNQGTNHIWSDAVMRLRGGGGGGGHYDIQPGGTVYLGDGLFNFLPGLTVSGGGLFEIVGDIELRGVLKLTNLVFSPDSNIRGVFTNAGTITWTAGTLAGHLTVAPGGILNISGETYLIGTITNRGTVVWSPPGDLHASETSVFCNEVGGIWNIQGDLSYNWNTLTVTNGRVVNAGLLSKTAGAGTNLFAQGISFANTGTIEVQTGTMRFDDIFYNLGTNEIWSGAVMRLRGGGGGAGHYEVAPGGALYLGHGSFNFLPELTLAGGGLFGVIGIVDLYGVMAVTNLTLTTDCNLGGNFTNAGTINWTDGTFTGELSIAPGGVLNITNNAYLSGTITNLGTVFQAGNIYAAETSVLCNQAGSVWEMQNGASYIYNSLVASNALVVNAGILRKIGGTGTNIFGQAVTFNNNGTVDIQRGTILFESGYVQSASGALVLTLAGLTPGTQHARVITSLATLDGALNIALADGYQPQLGHTFSLVTYAARSGNFSTLGGAAVGSLYLTPFYGANNFTLTAIPNELAPLVFAPLVENNLFQFQIIAPSEQTCVIFTSTNLVDWEPISTNTLGGEFQFSDTNMIAWPRRFFRAVTSH